MNKFSIITCLLAFYGYNSEVSQQCLEKFRGDQIKCGQTISDDLNCNAIEKYGLQFLCESDTHKCCETTYAIECTKPFVNQWCGVDVMNDYIEQNFEVLVRCANISDGSEFANYSYGSDACEKYKKYRLSIKLCVENFEPKREQCLRSANEKWNCIPNCGDDWQRVCCSRWQYSDCMRAEAKQVCDQLMIDEVITPFIHKVMNRTNCTEFIYGSEECQKSHETTKNGSSTLLIIVIVILLLLNIICAIIVIRFFLCKKSEKSEEETNSQQNEHNQQRSDEDSKIIRSSSVSSSANDSDSAKIIKSDPPLDQSIDLNENVK